MDDKTGAGTYIIYINTNDSTFKNSTGFKYQVKIQTGTAPINISIAEGDSTTKNIIVNFNQTNIYREMGECILQIVKYQDDEYAGTVYSLKINETTLGEASASITSSGTHYIQIVSPSNTLLYSYKVIKNEPLNAAAIISIVISVVVLIVVIIIIIKLRKRISVK